MKQDVVDFTGYFGEFGGRFVPEHLVQPLQELENAFKQYSQQQSFWDEFNSLLKHFVGRPTPLLFAENATKALGGANLFLKLECLANTGAHKINNALGQAILAKRMGKTRIIAETGAGQHGIATAVACARLGLECEIYMGANDVARQRPNVFWMEMLGAKVIPVTSGTQTLTDAVDAAFLEWERRANDTHYLIGSAVGPSPYPDMVREFQSIIGKETKMQFTEMRHKLPDVLIACVGGGSNSIGFFSEFIDDTEVKLIGIEGGGRSSRPGDHASRMTGEGGKLGVVQGYKSVFLLDEEGNLQPTHSISAGLDYAGIGPQLAYLGQSKRIEFKSVKDSEVLQTLKFFAKHEGLIPALESTHALAYAMKLAKEMDKEKNIIVNVSGRGDKDIFITAGAFCDNEWIEFLKEEINRHELNLITNKAF